MKHAIFLILFFAFVSQIRAQDQPQRRVRQRPVAEKDSSKVSSALSNMTERAKIKNETESQQPAHITWERIIYRQVDLKKEEINAALYYPVMPQNGRQNLFTLLFKWIADGKITPYAYSEVENFTDDHKANFEEILKRMQLLYTKEGERFVVDERDIPSSEITAYMIKEGYAFDQATSTLKNNVLAISPILVQEDLYGGGTQREPLFWLKYDDIRPYLSREMIMTSNYNNTMTYTLDDYFRKNMYVGEILKTVNMMGQSLTQQVGGEPEDLKHAQDSIETQLKTFGKELWMYNDSTGVKKPSNQPSKAKKSKKSEKGEKKPANSEVEPKASEPAKSSSDSIVGSTGEALETS
ncbi:MAG: gliding motility protein GldN [Dysgonamonadaceae bacterium]|jgi:gliding motility associated protien GldN|nr:gliding motility protein GldN [Dysgonamonadaceae bacterium]